MVPYFNQIRVVFETYVWNELFKTENNKKILLELNIGITSPSLKNYIMDALLIY